MAVVGLARSTSTPASSAEARTLNFATATGSNNAGPTTPLMLRLMTAMGADDNTAGTELTNAGGATYAAQSLASKLAVAAWDGTLGKTKVTNNAVVRFDNLPTVTSPTAIVGVEVWDSAGTPIRWWAGTLVTARNPVPGDSLEFAVSALVFTMD